MKRDSLAIKEMYDSQAGDYVARYNQLRDRKDYYNNWIIDNIKKLGSHQKILEAGCGEATTLKPISEKIDSVFYGFDISEKRIDVAKNFAKGLNLFVSDMKKIPYEDNFFDLVYTAHSIEPNIGNEKVVISELYRVTKNFLLLIEPIYELSSNQSRERMDNLGYCRGLLDICQDYNVVKVEMLDNPINPLNETGIIVIQK